MMGWFVSFRRCWQLARQLQRGELVAVAPDYLNALIASASQIKTIAESIRPPEPAPPSTPLAVEGGAYAEESGEFQVRLLRDGVVKVIAKGPASEMKTYWRNHRPARPHCVIELFDVKLGIVRGNRTA